VKLDQETLGLNSNDNITVRHDNTLTKNYEDPYDGELSVAVPVPDPLDARLPADNGSILTYDEDSGVIWNSTTDFFNNNTDLEIFNVNNGHLSLNWELIDGSGGLCVFQSSRDTLGVALADAGGINRYSNGDLYVGTDNTLVTHEKTDHGDTYLSVAVPVPDPEEHDAHDGDVLCYDSREVPSVFWSDRITLLEARVAALEDALNGNQFSVNGSTPTVNGYTPTINQ
jgi:hypothetical protein